MQMLLLLIGREILLPPSTPCCKICSSKEAIIKYESKGVAGKLFPGKLGMSKDLVLTKRISDYEFHCTRCGWSRPDPILEHDGVTKLWYVSCNKCNERHISTDETKCAHCDLGVL